jgi:hypothetical protein
MDKALKGRVIPTLRQAGFTGSFPHFRRIQGERTDLITFQFDKWGGGFVIEIGCHQGSSFKTYLGVHHRT